MNLCFGQKGHVFRHAVNAAEIASVGDRDAQIGYMAAKRIDHRDMPPEPEYRAKSRGNKGGIALPPHDRGRDTETTTGVSFSLASLYRFGLWERQGEPRPLADGTFDREVALHHLRELTGNGEAEASAFGFAAQDILFNLIEGIEYTF